MSRVTNDRALMEGPEYFIQIESNYTNFWVLLETANDYDSTTDRRIHRWERLSNPREATSHYE